MNLKKISLNLYSFGYYGGFIKDEARTRESLNIDGLVQLVKKHGLGGVEIPLDHFYSVGEIRQGIEKIEKIRAEDLSVFIDLEKTNVEYITQLLRYLPSLGIQVVRIKMDQIDKTIYGGNRYDSDTFNAAVEQFKQQLTTLRPLLEKYQVALAIENHQDFHSSELVQIADSISNEWIGETWDVGNSVSVIDSTDSFYETAGHLIRNAHLKDYKIYKSDAGIRLVRCSLGAGYVDYADVLQKLMSNDRVVNMSIELGAQVTRECDHNNERYWQEYADVSMDRDGYLEFVEQHALDQGRAHSDYEEGVGEERLIESELADIDESVAFLSNLNLGVNDE